MTSRGGENGFVLTGGACHAGGFFFEPAAALAPKFRSAASKEIGWQAPYTN